MKCAVFAFLALAVVSECAPISMSPEDLKGITTNVQSASADLNSMLDAENHELGEMEKVKNDITSIEGKITEAKVQAEAGAVDNEEVKAVKNEDVQQNAALKALQEVKNAGAALSKFNSPKDSKLFKAGQKIKQVQDALEIGTKTSNNQKLLKQMVKQSEGILKSSNDDQPEGDDGDNPGGGGEELGETNPGSVQHPQHDPEPAEKPQKKMGESGVLTQLTKVKANANANPQPPPDQQGNANAAAPQQPAAGGALSLLANVQQDKAQIQQDKKNMAADEYKVLKAELPEEATVADAENRAVAEIKGLVKDLN